MQSERLGDAKRKIGGLYFFAKQLSELKLLSGIDNIDQLIASKMESAAPAGLTLGKEGLLLLAAFDGKVKYVGIRFDEIESINWIGGIGNNTERIHIMFGLEGIIEAALLNAILQSNYICFSINLKRNQKILIATDQIWKKKVEKFFNKYCQGLFSSKIITKDSSDNTSKDKEQWIAIRLLELVGQGKTAANARIQAEAEYRLMEK